MHNVLGHRLESGPIAPLKLVRGICELPENVARNIALTLSKKYVRFNEYMDKQSGPVSICGSGPSLAWTYQNLVGDVVACNGAHDFLIKRGVVPRYAMVFDASELMDQFITPHEEVTYFIASRCHESVFKRLEGHKVVVWHAKGDPCLPELLEAHDVDEPMLHGGSAAVTRAMFLTWVLGHKETHLFGADSSYEEDHHVGKTLVPEAVLDVWATGKWFKSTAWMAGQVEDFKMMAPDLKEMGMEIIIHGDGLLPAIAKVMGFTVNEREKYEAAMDEGLVAAMALNQSR